MAERETPTAATAGASDKDEGFESEATPRTPRAQPFRLVDLDDEIATAPKPWLVEGLLGADEMSGLIAPAFMGKSTLAVDLSAAIASGRPWFGHAVTRGAVLYVAAERWRLTACRFNAWRAHHDCPTIPIGITREPVNLLEADCDRLISTAIELKTSTSWPLRLIVLDTMRSTMVGDENGARDMSRYTHALMRLRNATGAHVLVIHHTPKRRDSEAAGHSGLPAAIDVLMVISAQRDRLRWRVTHANDLVVKPSGDFNLISVDEVGVVAPLEHVPSGDTLKGDMKLVHDAIVAIAPTTRAEARQAVYAALGQRNEDAKRRAFSDNLKRLSGLGRLVVVGTSDDARIHVREREDSVRKREEAHEAHVRCEREVSPPLGGDLTSLTPNDMPDVPDFLVRHN